MFKDNIAIIKSYFQLVKGSRFWTVMLFVGSILGHLSSLLIPVFASNIIYDVTNGNVNSTWLNIALLAGSFIIHALLWQLNYSAYARSFVYSYRSLREQIINKVATYDADFGDKISKGAVQNTVGVDVSSLSDMIDCICEVIVVMAKVVIMIGIFAWTNVYVGFFVLIIELIYLKSYDYCNTMAAKYLVGQRKYRDQLTDNLGQTLNGLNEIKTFNIFSKIKSEFNNIVNKWAKQYIKTCNYTNLSENLLNLVPELGKVILYSILVIMTFNKHIEINTLVLLITYYETIMSNSREVMNYSKLLRNRAVSITRINQLLNYTSDNIVSFGNYNNDNITGKIEFKNVSFTYKARNHGNISNVSFTAEPHQITALVGHSGCGKTTITNLLLRRYCPDQGNINVDNRDIYDFTPAVYATNVVGVNQFPFIFNMSIKRNLSLIDPNVDNQIEACKRVGIHDYIMSLPRGYNTILTENATNFSGGQRQLLAIARTLLSKAEVLIFDEVTSSLDTTLVEKIKGIFMDLRQDHTIIIVTHKKDIMQLVDKLIVIDHGQIVGQGSHDELMKDNSYYINLQTSCYSSPSPTQEC